MSTATDTNGVAAVAAQSARALRGLAEKVASQDSEIITLREKVANYERRDQVRALAKEMDDRGLSPELNMDEKIASISKYPNLDLVRESIKLAGGGRLDMARVDDSTAASHDDATRSFANFCVTGQANP
jgi:hypothetical protein